MLTLFAVALCALLGLKLWQIGATMLWEIRTFFGSAAGQTGGDSVVDLKDFDSYPKFLPFGYKDVRLREWRVKGAFPLKVLTRVFNPVFKYPVLAFLAGGCALWELQSHGPDATRYGLRHLDSCVNLVLVLGLVACSLTVSLLAALSSAMDVVAPTRRPPVVGRTSEYPNAGFLFARMALTPRAGELATLAANVVFGSLSACIAVTYASGISAAFAGIPRVTGLLERLFDSAYFTMTTFTTVGFGDIYPASDLGRAITMCLEAQTFVLVVVVFALMTMRWKAND